MGLGAAAAAFRVFQRALVAGKRGGKGGRAGKEPLLQGHQHEVGGELLGMVAGTGLPQLGILPQRGVDLLFLAGIIHFQGFQNPLRESVLAEVVLGKFRLEPPDHDRIALPDEFLGVGSHPAGKSLVVEQFQQGREALLVAVVRRGREEHLVLEVRGQPANRLRAERVDGIIAAAGRGAVVGLVEDQDVVAAGIDRFAFGRQGFHEQPQGPIALEEVDGRNQPGKVRPRIDVDAPFPSQVAHQFTIDDAEIQAELVPHLVPPLGLERGRADDQSPAGSVANHQFQIDHAGLDGLAEAHVVGNEQADPGHLDRADHRIELVVFNRDARAERRLDVANVGGRGRAPAHGVEERIQPVGGIEAGRLRQGDILDDGRARLQFPNHLEFFAEGVVFDRGKRDQVLAVAVERLQRRGGKRALGDLAHDVLPLPNRDQLPLFRRIRRNDGHAQPSLASDLTPPGRHWQASTPIYPGRRFSNTSDHFTFCGGLPASCLVFSRSPWPSWHHRQSARPTPTVNAVDWSTLCSLSRREKCGTAR